MKINTKTYVHKKFLILIYRFLHIKVLCHATIPDKFSRIPLAETIDRNLRNNRSQIVKKNKKFILYIFQDI